VLSDFIDCIILSSAISQTEALIIEDEGIHGLKEEIQSIKLGFKIHRLKEIIEEIPD